MCVCVCFYFPPLLFIYHATEKKKKHTDTLLFCFFFLHQSFNNRGAEKKNFCTGAVLRTAACVFSPSADKRKQNRHRWRERLPCSFNLNHDRRFDFIIPVANPWNRQLIANPSESSRTGGFLYYYFFTRKGREGQILIIIYIYKKKTKQTTTSQRGLTLDFFVSGMNTWTPEVLVIQFLLEGISARFIKNATI